MPEQEPELGIKQRAVMLVLMAEARPIRNPELKKLAGFELVRKEREYLNERELVFSWKEGQAYVHELTEDGWKWCKDELSGPRPGRVGSAGGALYVLLAGLDRFLDSSGLPLTEIFQQDVPATNEQVELENRIRSVYQELAGKPGPWVSLATLRPLLNGVRRTEVDEVLRRMTRSRDVSIIPESNQKTLTDEDRAAAVRVGGKDKHLLSIGEA
jgi:hypothetical protein